MKRIAMTTRVKVWPLTQAAMREAVSRGLSQAQRHETPDLGVVEDCVTEAVLVKLCELFDLGEQE